MILWFYQQPACTYGTKPHHLTRARRVKFNTLMCVCEEAPARGVIYDPDVIHGAAALTSTSAAALFIYTSHKSVRIHLQHKLRQTSGEITGWERVCVKKTSARSDGATKSVPSEKKYSTSLEHQLMHTWFRRNKRTDKIHMFVFFWFCGQSCGLLFSLSSPHSSSAASR